MYHAFVKASLHEVSHLLSLKSPRGSQAVTSIDIVFCFALGFNHALCVTGFKYPARRLLQRQERGYGAGLTLGFHIGFGRSRPIQGVDTLDWY